jgi:hypothetical protein
MDIQQLETFFEKLEGPEGCDFQQEDPEDVKSIT